MCLLENIASTRTHTQRLRKKTACVSDCHEYTRGSAVHRPRLSFRAACSCLFPPPKPAGAPLSCPLPPTAIVRALIPVATHQGSAICLSKHTVGRTLHNKPSQIIFVCAFCVALLARCLKHRYRPSYRGAHSSVDRRHSFSESFAGYYRCLQTFPVKAVTQQCMSIKDTDTWRHASTFGQRLWV